ncbi:MAG: hypothetical protein K0R62_4518 [Nonomuraea muscovyensis]|nr:hypothetical protein [Nonomuraea muscovyensis]
MSAITSPFRNAVSPPWRTADQLKPSPLVHRPSSPPRPSPPLASQSPSPPTTRCTVDVVAPVTWPSCQVLPLSGENRKSGRGVGIVVSLPTATTTRPAEAMSFSFWLEPSPADGTVNRSSPERPVPAARRRPGLPGSVHRQTSTPPAMTRASASTMATGAAGLRRPRVGLARRRAAGAGPLWCLPPAPAGRGGPEATSRSGRVGRPAGGRPTRRTPGSAPPGPAPAPSPLVPVPGSSPVVPVPDWSALVPVPDWSALVPVPDWSATGVASAGRSGASASGAMGTGTGRGMRYGVVGLSRSGGPSAPPDGRGRGGPLATSLSGLFASRRGLRGGSAGGGSSGELYGLRPLGGSGGSSSGTGAENGGIPQGEASGRPLARSSLGPGGACLIRGSSAEPDGSGLSCVEAYASSRRGSSSPGGRRGRSLGPEATRRTS